MTACPRCGQAFDEPVPADATPAEAGKRIVAVPPAPKASAQRAVHLPKIALWLTASLTLMGLGWLLGVHHAAPPGPTLPAPAPSTVPINNLPTDLAAHPGYKAGMSAFLSKLRGTGVGAQWPAFSDNDTLVITPQAVVNGQRAAYNPDLYRELAQGVYAHFVFCRYEAGFSDTDSTTCFVIVSDSSGRVVAADLMGNLE